MNPKELNFNDDVYFDAQFEVCSIIESPIDDEVTETSENPVKSSGIYKFVQEKVEDISEIKEKINELEDDVTDLNVQVGIHNTEISNISDRVSTTESDISTINSTLDEHKSSIDTNTNDINSLNGRLTNAESDINSTKDDISTINSTMSELSTKIDTNTDDITSLGGRVTNVESDLQEVHQQLTTIESDIDDIGSEVDTLSTTKADKTEIPTKISQLDNDSSFTTKTYVDDIADDINITIEQLEGVVTTKQDKLVSGTNIKTINGESVLGEGNIEIKGGEGDVTKSYLEDNYYNKTTVDTKLSDKASSQSVTDLADRVSTNETSISNLDESKQDNLVSGTNIKTINNQSLLGEGNIEIESGSGDVSYEDSESTEIPQMELPLYASGEYAELNSTDKHIIGAINEALQSGGTTSNGLTLKLHIDENTEGLNSAIDVANSSDKLKINRFISDEGLSHAVYRTISPFSYSGDIYWTCDNPRISEVTSSGNMISVWVHEKITKAEYEQIIADSPVTLYLWENDIEETQRYYAARIDSKSQVGYYKRFCYITEKTNKIENGYINFVTGVAYDITLERPSRVINTNFSIDSLLNNGYIINEVKYATGTVELNYDGVNSYLNHNLEELRNYVATLVGNADTLLGSGVIE